MRANFLAFKVAGGRLVVTEISQYEGRGDRVLWLLGLLHHAMPEAFEGKTGCVWYDDRPPSDPLSEKFDLPFCTTKEAGIASPYMPFPCPNSLAWPQVGIENGSDLTHRLLVAEASFESGKVFWIGADTNPIRRDLCEMGRSYPETFDAEIMEWDRTPGVAQNFSKTRYVSIPDHRKYKYLIDCPGVGYSGRLRWLLASGRPVFIVERSIVEAWHESLVPWVHFIPVNPDLSDLLANHRRIEEDPQLYGDISRRAREFVRSNLLVEQEFEMMERRLAERCVSR